MTPDPTTLAGLQRRPIPTARWIRQASDRIAGGIAAGGAGVVVIILVTIALVLIHGAMPAIKAFGLDFLVSSDWDPERGRFGCLPMIAGTVISSLLCLVIAVPLSIGTAVFLVRAAPRWLAGPVSFLIELLAAIPSIAFGFWGAAALTPLTHEHLQLWLRSLLGHIPVLNLLVGGMNAPSNMLVAAIVLALMVMPIITAVSRDVLRALPRELEEGAYALGATWWQATRMLIGASRVGLLGAVILGFARAIGETMAVTMVIGNSDNFSPSLLTPTQTLASLLANEFLEADKAIYLHALVYAALVLLVLTLVMNACARWLIDRASTIGRKPRSALVPGGPSVETGRPAPTQTIEAAPAASMATVAGTMVLPPPEGQDTAAVLVLTGPRGYRGGGGMRHGISRLMIWVSAGCAAIGVGMLAWILGYLIYKGVGGLSWDFFTKLPGLGPHHGMRNCIVGTAILIAMASAWGIPAGLACGIYLAEYASTTRFGRVVRLLVDVLAGTPSIVVGVVIYAIMVKPMGHYSGWAGSVALSIMMCPIVARVTEEMLRLVPQVWREASLGAGATRAQTLWRVVIPAATSGLVTGIMLAVARIAGETAPLLFTALGTDSDVYRPDQQFPALTLKIFEYATSADAVWQQQAWAGMLVLVLLIMVLNLLVRLGSRRQLANRP